LAQFEFISEAFAHPVVRGVVLFVVVLLAITPMVFEGLSRGGRIGPDLKKELYARYKSWLVIAPAMLVPIILGRLWTIGAVGILSLLCYREFARATGLFRERLLSLIVVLGIGFLTFAAADHYYAMFVAITPLAITAIVIVAVLADKPTGYIQRVALATFAFVLFGSCLGHLGYLANDSHFRPLVLAIIFCVEANDIFAYITGKTLGRRKLAPNTSPNKTLAGGLGALLLTSAVFAVLAHFIFTDTVLDQPMHLIAIGAIVSIAGQFGDLVLSSIKRDLGIKDMAATIPGHGGLLDRFDSLLLVAPCVFHYVGYHLGIGLDQPTHIFTGG
jgi:phosphatidate cytidylyltransferase